MGPLCQAEAARGAGFGRGPGCGFTESGELVADEAEAATVERIRALRADGRSLSEIAATLTAEGHATKRGGRWHPETLRLVVGRL